MLLTGVFTVSSLSAQVSIKDGMFATGVSNDGIAVGEMGENTPYYIWDTKSGGIKQIGGISAGNGIGGWATISADGRYVSGTDFQTVSVDTQLKRHKLEGDYIITQMAVGSSHIIAVGKDKENKNGVILQSGDMGKHWKKLTYIPDLKANGLETIAFLNGNTGVIGGWDGIFLYTSDGGTEWKNVPAASQPGVNDPLKVIRAVDALKVNHVVAIGELEDGTSKVYYSENGAETWADVSGIEGNPVTVCHSPSHFFLTTNEGTIYTSTDGKHWVACMIDNNQSLNAISFMTDEIGMAAGANGVVFKTTDGGKSWEKMTINSTADFQAIAWHSNEKIYLAGESEALFYTEDAGKSWKRVNQELADVKGTIHDMMVLGTDFVACGSNNVFYTKAFMNTANFTGMARYDNEAGIWEHLGCLEIPQSGKHMSSGYAVSGDGKTVVGNAHQFINSGTIESADVSHAAVWNEEKGELETLDGHYTATGRSTRLDAVNHDGTVAVGQQDKRGPWLSSVWRKQADGSWDKGQHLLLDPAAGENDYNIMPQCRSVSPNGKWVGGMGKVSMTGPLAVASASELSEPYIWSEESGVKLLGMLDKAPASQGFYGITTGVNNDGTLAVGFFVTSYPTTPNMYSFIWTREKGIQDLNDFVREELKYDLKDLTLHSALALSENGRYIAAWGMNKQGAIQGAVIDLEGSTTANEEITDALDESKVYMTPGLIHIELPAEIGTVKCQLFGLGGQLMKNCETNSVSTTIAVNGLPAGIYILNLTTEDTRLYKTYKLKVNF